MKPTLLTWILVLFGLVLILLPMIYTQGLMLTLWRGHRKSS